MQCLHENGDKEDDEGQTIHWAVPGTLTAPVEQCGSQTWLLQAPAPLGFAAQALRRRPANDTSRFHHPTGTFSTSQPALKTPNGRHDQQCTFKSDPELPLLVQEEGQSRRCVVSGSSAGLPATSMEGMILPAEEAGWSPGSQSRLCPGKWRGCPPAGQQGLRGRHVPGPGEGPVTGCASASPATLILHASPVCIDLPPTLRLRRQCIESALHAVTSNFKAPIHATADPSPKMHTTGLLYTPPLPDWRIFIHLQGGILRMVVTSKPHLPFEMRISDIFDLNLCMLE